MLETFHMHPDWNLAGVAAMPVSLLLLAVSLCFLARALSSGRAQVKDDLARIFEQLDLLRFDAQQTAATSGLPDILAEASAPPRAALWSTTIRQRSTAAKAGIGDYYAATQLAARGSTVAEIAERCGIVSGEARVLVALQQARVRRAEAK